MVVKRNILILHAAALGDFVLTWPLALALCRLHPQSRIIYVTHPSKGALATRFVGTETAGIDTGGWHTLHGSAPALPPETRQMIESSSAIYSFLHSPGDQVARNLAVVAPEADICCLDPQIPADYAGHITAFFQGQITSRPALYSTCAAMVQSISKRGVIGPRGRHKRILIHPGAGSAKKCWPVERFIEVANRLSDQKRNVAFVVGEVEADRFTAEQLGQLAAAAPLLRPQSYLELADEMLASHTLITNDNGPGHLAGVLGIGVISLFGPSNPTHFHPIGPRTHVLHNPDLDRITPDQVLACLVA